MAARGERRVQVCSAVKLDAEGEHAIVAQGEDWL
jgi:hypothetical protein